MTVADLKQFFTEEYPGYPPVNDQRIFISGKSPSNTDTLSTLFPKDVKQRTLHLCPIVTRSDPSRSPALVVPTSRDNSEVNEENRGFGLLRLASFTDEEIEVIRLTYFPHVEMWSRRQFQNPREDPHHRWLRLEEEWMQLQAQDVSSEFYTNVARSASHRVENFNFGATLPTSQTPTIPTIPTTSTIPTTTVPVDFASLRAMAAITDPSRRRQRNVERSFMVTDAADLSAEVEQNGTAAARSFLPPFLLGIMLGPILLFWLGDNSMSKKQKTGLVCGVFVNMLLQWLPGSTSSGSQHLRGNLNSTDVSEHDESVGSSVLVRVEDVSGNLPLSGVSSVHYNAKLRNAVPDKVG